MSTTEISEKLYTVEEFLNLEWPEDDETEYELIGGRIIAKPGGGTSAKHGDIIAQTIYYLQAYAGIGAGEKAFGKVYTGAACNLGRPKGLNFPEPDVCFVAKGRTPDDFSGPIPVAPDLVVEVWSPSDTTEKIQIKIDAYLEAGVRLIWSIYMVSKYVLIYRQDNPDIRFLNLKGELEGEDVLPGFKLPVKTLFE